MSKKSDFFFNWKLWKIPSSKNVCRSWGKEFLELLLKLVNGKMLNVVTEWYLSKNKVAFYFPERNFLDLSVEVTNV